MGWDGHQPVVVCEYCQSVQGLPTTGATIDRVIPLGQATDCACPRCDELLVQAAIDGLKAQNCPSCHGILIDGETFGMLVQRRRAKFRGPEAQPVRLDAAQLAVQVDCPSCELAMEVHPYYGPGNIVIDSCRRCRLVWLDRGEVSRVEAASGRR